MACHVACLARDQIFGQLAQLCLVFEGGLASSHQKFSCVLYGCLLAETHSEYMVLDCLKELSQARHVHRDFLLKVIAAVHAF